MLEFGLQPDNLIVTASTLLGWGILISLVLRRYRRSPSLEQPALWRVLLVAIVSLFSFSIPFSLGDHVWKLALVPLGVWIVYLFISRKSRPRYRAYAWIGFWCNYVFLAVGLLGFWGHGLAYPKDQLSTYISHIDHAVLVGIHPSAEEGTLLDEAEFLAAAEVLKPQRQFDIFSWHGAARERQEETFPYALLGGEPKWGSGIQYEAYVKSDGMGIIIASGNHTYYFASDKSLLQWADGREGR